MSWAKIEQHLFDKYCVEGKDETLEKLMQEHDTEVRNGTIDEFSEKCKNHIFCQTGFGLKSRSIDEIAEDMVRNL